MPKVEDFLRSLDIFSRLKGEELSILRTAMREKFLNTGEVLFHEKEKGDELYIVKHGSIAVSVLLPDGDDLEISEISEGNFFGEMAIFEHAPRSATCTAKEESHLLSLGRDAFYELIRSHPGTATEIMYKMLNITTERLRNTNNFLSDMVQWGEKARKRAVTDDFTGLYNRRFLEDALEEKFSRARIKNEQFSIAMVDLDYFGELNKEYGEEIGDKVILAAVSVFHTVFDEDDILVRYGGDEFTVIMPGKDADTARAKCRTVCAELRKCRILEDMNGNISQITSSIGIAVFPQHAKSAKKLMDKADGALYKAKERGRNRAELSD